MKCITYRERLRITVGKLSIKLSLFDVIPGCTEMAILSSSHRPTIVSFYRTDGSKASSIRYSQGHS